MSKNALNRFQTALNKQFDERLDGLDEEARAAVEQSDDVKSVKDWVRRVEREEDGESGSSEEVDDEESSEEEEEEDDEDAASDGLDEADD